jgi:hypothetical protein
MGDLTGEMIVGFITLWALCGCFCWAVAAIFAELVKLMPSSRENIKLARFCFASVVLVTSVHIGSVELNGTKAFLSLVASGLVVGVSGITLLGCIRRTSISLATFVIYCLSYISDGLRSNPTPKRYVSKRRSSCSSAFRWLARWMFRLMACCLGVFGILWIAPAIPSLMIATSHAVDVVADGLITFLGFPCPLSPHLPFKRCYISDPSTSKLSIPKLIGLYLLTLVLALNSLWALVAALAELMKLSTFQRASKDRIGKIRLCWACSVLAVSLDIGSKLHGTAPFLWKGAGMILFGALGLILLGTFIQCMFGFAANINHFTETSAIRHFREPTEYVEHEIW